MPVTGQSWFSTGKNVDSYFSLADLSSDQLRERLMVAETMMKKLFSRSKELELQLAQS